MEQSRAANLILCFGIHDLNGFQKSDQEFTDMILWNTWNKIIFRPVESETSANLNKLIGESHILVITPNDGAGKTIFSTVEEPSSSSQYDCMSLAPRECILTDGAGNVTQLLMDSVAS